MLSSGWVLMLQTSDFNARSRTQNPASNSIKIRQGSFEAVFRTQLVIY